MEWVICELFLYLQRIDLYQTIEDIIMQLKPTIIGISEGIHYLVGATDENQYFFALPSLLGIEVCGSLSEAKELLRAHDVNEAEFLLQTPYDEMCGLPPSPPIIETIHFKI